MARILSLALLSAGMLLSGSALADNCLTPSSDPAVSFPDGSYDYIFAVNSDGKGGYDACFYSPTVLNMSAFGVDALDDFNDDGWEDLVLGVRSSGGGEVQVFLNDGTGSGIVVANAPIPTGGTTAPNVIGTADLDQDGWPDLLTSNGADGTVSVMLNDKTGNFPAVKQYAAGSKITLMAAADLDGDGYPDIVTNDTANPSVDVLMNKGDGDFKAAAAIRVGSIPTAMRVADLNGDGFPDIVTASGQNVSVLLNNGDGSFAPAVNYYSIEVMFVTLMDVNNDGLPDIVVADNFQASYAVYAMVNNGDGTFAAPDWFVLGAENSGTSGVTIGISGGGGFINLGGSTPPPTLTNTYTAASGKVTKPVTGATIISGKGKASGSGGSTGSTKNAAPASSGGGEMEWISLMLLGLAGVLRRKRA